jgi:two-component system phosphate regulon sensor histidine kinase PhoR
MIRSSERLSRILDDLLDLSRIEAGKYGFDLEELDVRNAVDHASEAVERASKEKRIVLSHSVPEEVLVLADAKALDQVLVNLLDNAVKYTPEGGSVLVRGTRQGDRIRIEVEDDGPGIEPKHRERIFERFYRVDKGRSRQLGGTGLGLAIVKHLVESMDGRVGVLPAEPHGSIFYVELPATGE